VSHRWLWWDDPASGGADTDISQVRIMRGSGRGVRCGRWVYGGIAAMSQEAIGF